MSIGQTVGRSRRTITKPGLAVLAIAAAVRVTAAQPPAAPPPDPIVRAGATTKLAEHVYVIPDHDVPLVPNVGIVVGPRGTLVIDTGLGRRNGETVAREAAKVAVGPQRYLAVTHVHPEHDLGAAAFPADTTLLRSRDQDRDIAEFGMQLANAFASQSPARAALLDGAAFRKTDISFDRTYAIDLGGTHVTLMAVGPTHTRGDTVFFVEEDRILFAGDVVMSAFPAFASPYSSVRAWLAALDRLERLHARVIVPSHGRVADASDLARYRDYLRAVQSRVAELKRAGKTADDAAQILQPELAARFGMAQPARIAGAVKAAFNES
jgi:glyoxylase-like metal-dependent hydrolase (beta-lactamase superfamily II)